MANIIKTRDGEKQVRSMYNAGDFFVHARYKEEGYTITHRPTGLAVCFCYKKKMAFRKVKELAYAYDIVSQYVAVAGKTGRGNDELGRIMKRVREIGAESGYLEEAAREIIKHKDRNQQQVAWFERDQAEG